MATFLTLQDIGDYDVASNFPDNPTDEEKAYGSNGSEGTVLNLNVDEISIAYETALNTNPATQKKKSNDQDLRFEWGEVDKNTIMFPLWTIKCTFDSGNLTTDMRDYGRLLHMYKTKGYKKLGWSAATGCEILTYNQYGEREYDAEGTKTVTSVNVRIKSITPKQLLKSGYQIKVTIELDGK